MRTDGTQEHATGKPVWLRFVFADTPVRKWGAVAVDLRRRIGRFSYGSRRDSHPELGNDLGRCGAIQGQFLCNAKAPVFGL